MDQDTFLANGKSLVGDQYHWQGSNQFENGVIVERDLVGVFACSTCPTAACSSSAFGHWTSSSLTGFFTVDKGDSGDNIDAFCAALS